MARPGRPPRRDVYEAVESFATELNGVPIVVKTGMTTETGSTLLERYPQLFRRIRVTFPATPTEEEVVERFVTATAAPNEERW